MSEELKPVPKKRREEALPERLLRRVLEGMGDVVDRKFGRTVAPPGGLTTSQLIERMKRLIDERVRDEGRKGRLAPHHLKLKVEWGTHSEAPPENLKELEHEILAAAIDHINDHRYRTRDTLEIRVRRELRPRRTVGSLDRHRARGRGRKPETARQPLGARSPLSA